MKATLFKLLFGASTLLGLASSGMAADFQSFFPKFIATQGGYVNDPADPGGSSNKGITMSVFRPVAKSMLGVEPTLENLRNLTREQAATIYKKRYWDLIRGDEIDSQVLADMIFDFYAHVGGNAIRTLQSTLNDAGAAPALVVDGTFSPAVLNAVKKADATDLYRRYKAARRQYYTRLADSRSALKPQLGVWLKRVDAFPDL